MTVTIFFLVLGCIALSLTFFYFKKIKRRIIKQKKEKNGSLHYIYVLWNPSFGPNLFKVGKSRSKPSKLVGSYNRAHSQPCEFVLLWNINDDAKLDKAEEILLHRFAERRAVLKKVRKEIFSFNSSKEIYTECFKAFNLFNISYYDLIKNNEFDRFGKDLIKGNEY